MLYQPPTVGPSLNVRWMPTALPGHVNLPAWLRLDEDESRVQVLGDNITARQLLDVLCDLHGNNSPVKVMVTRNNVPVPVEGTVVSAAEFIHYQRQVDYYKTRNRRLAYHCAYMAGSSYVSLYLNFERYCTTELFSTVPLCQVMRDRRYQRGFRRGAVQNADSLCGDKNGPHHGMVSRSDVRLAIKRFCRDFKRYLQSTEAPTLPFGGFLNLLS